MYNGGWTGRFTLRKTRKDSLLVGLKVTNQVVAHREILSKFKQPAALSVGLKLTNQLVAHREILSKFKQPAAVVRSSTIIKKVKR